MTDEADTPSVDGPTLERVPPAPASEEPALDVEPGGWMMRWFPCVFLLYLAFPLVESWSRGGAERVVGAATVVVFAAWYATGMVSPWPFWRERDRAAQAQVWAWLAVLVGLAAVLARVAGFGGFGSAMTYVACGGAGVLPRRPGGAVVVGSGFAVAAACAATGNGVLEGIGYGVWVGVIGFSVWASMEYGRQRGAVTRAREERAALAVELERARFARDLHDILGHSLTVITVKAELAARLVDADPQRAKAELADLERLSRDALADVRSTVSGYRTLSLPLELAGARRALEAAEIRADVPGAADDVPSDLRDLFAWTIREGVTNVVRHSGARGCTVALTSASVEVRDDGRGAGGVRAGATGHGLLGLAERARLAGARLVTDPSASGFVLRVEAVPSGAAPPSGRAPVAPTRQARAAAGAQGWGAAPCDVERQGEIASGTSESGLGSAPPDGVPPRPRDGGPDGDTRRVEATLPRVDTRGTP